MIYKKYEFSLSLNGEQLIHIARNAAGVVVFRARSEKELKALIDENIYEQEQRAAQIAKKQAEEKKEHKRTEHLRNSTEEIEETAPSEKSILQASVTRGPDGKFISKSRLEAKEPRKKGFWEKLTS